MNRPLTAEYIVELFEGVKDCQNESDWKHNKKRFIELIKEYGTEQCAINVVSNCEVWKPTMILRWLETDNYNPVNNDFDKVLQQKWQSDTGEEKWEDIEVYGI